jgi:hypothetical protein
MRQKFATHLFVLGQTKWQYSKVLNLVLQHNSCIKHVPFVSGVHFMAHCTNLAIQTFSGLTLVAKIETLLVGMYNFFTDSHK